MLFLKTFVFFRKEMLFLSQGYFRVHQTQNFCGSRWSAPKIGETNSQTYRKTLGTRLFWGTICFPVLQCESMYATVSTREAWGRLCFSACVSSLFSPVPQIRTLAPWAGPHFRIGCGVGGLGRAKVHSDGHEIWALGGGRQLGRPQLCKVSTVYGWPTCL